MSGSEDFDEELCDLFSNFSLYWEKAENKTGVGGEIRVMILEVEVMIETTNIEISAIPIPAFFRVLNNLAGHKQRALPSSEYTSLRVPHLANSPPATNPSKRLGSYTPGSNTMQVFIGKT